MNRDVLYWSLKQSTMFCTLQPRSFLPAALRRSLRARTAPTVEPSATPPPDAGFNDCPGTPWRSERTCWSYAHCDHALGSWSTRRRPRAPERRVDRRPRRPAAPSAGTRRSRAAPATWRAGRRPRVRRSWTEVAWCGGQRRRRQGRRWAPWRRGAVRS